MVGATGQSVVDIAEPLKHWLVSCTRFLGDIHRKVGVRFCLDWEQVTYISRTARSVVPQHWDIFKTSGEIAVPFEFQ